MIRLRTSLLLLAVCLGLAACSGGGGKRPASDAEVDYIDRVIPFVAGCNPGGATDNEALGHALEQAASDWNSIHPPWSLASLHQAYGAALSRAGDSYLQSGSTSAGLAGAAAAFDASRQAYNAWYSAFILKYRDALFNVEGAAMEPTFSNADVIPVRPLEVPPKRWDVLVFKFPLDPSRDFVKRVVALPRETVEVRDEHIYINGTILDGDRYANGTPNYTYAVRTVPADMYWVLGDNRRNSFDSHAWATNNCKPQQQCDFVPKANILGVVSADAKGCKARAAS